MTRERVVGYPLLADQREKINGSLKIAITTMTGYAMVTRGGGARRVVGEASTGSAGSALRGSGERRRGRDAYVSRVESSGVCDPSREKAVDLATGDGPTDLDLGRG